MHEILARILRVMSALAYGGALTLLLLAPMPARGWQLFPYADKVAHFIFLGLLGVALVRAFTSPQAVRVPLYAIIASIVLSCAYSIVIEFVQPQFRRGFDIVDIVAGIAGIFVFTLLWVAMRPRLRIIG